jgi:hypothetical protein
VERCAEMTLWLVMGGSSGFQKDKRIDLSIEACPTITAEGIGVVCVRGWQYWLEWEDDLVAGEAQPERALPGREEA